MKKFVLFLLALVLLTAPILTACDSGGDDDISPSLTETEQDGFYRNTKYGFSISYPPEWSAQKDAESGPALELINPSRTMLLQLVVQPLLETMTAQQFSEEVLVQFEDALTDFSISREGDVTVNGQPAYEVFFEGLQSESLVGYRMVSVLRGSQAFVILARDFTGGQSLTGTVVDGIINSFTLEEPQLAGVSRKGTLSLYDVGPNTLDPALVHDSTAASYAMEIFSGLVTLNRQLAVTPDIAERWEKSDDDTIYTFYLRRDVQFHDGRKVTAEDFRYSLERACDPETESRTAANYLGDIVGVDEKLDGTATTISGLKVIDDYTLQITIDAPKAYFLSKLVHPVAFVVDKENVSEGEDWWREPNGTGPFKLKDWEEDESIVLQRNDDYYGEMAKIENVVFRLWAGVPMVMYETSEIDIAPVYLSDIDRVLDTTNPLNSELVTVDEFSLWYIGFNTTKAPFDDPKVRQAFCHAIDKDRIIKLLLKDKVRRADGILPPGMPGYNEDVEGLQFDPQKAAALLAESNHPDLESVTFTTSGLGEISPITEAIVDMWQEYLGVEVEIMQIDPEIYSEEIKSEKDDLFDLGWVADFPDPQNFLDMLFYSQSEDNTGEYHNSEVDRLLEEARAEPDTDARMEMYRQIEQMLVDDAACLPLYFGIDYILVKPYVKGYVATPMPIPWLKYIWLESE